MVEQYWRNWFEYEGKRYYTGTVIKIIYFRGMYKSTTEVAFTGVDIRTGHHFVKYIYQGYRGHGMTEKGFYSSIIEVTDKVDSHVRYPVRKRWSEFEIPGMLSGWTWYIALMLLFTIFKDRWVLYFFTTLYFFAWRRKKINEEGYYIEW